jgi:hypothetical protein
LGMGGVIAGQDPHEVADTSKGKSNGSGSQEVKHD